MPAPTWRMYPARWRRTWLGPSASLGASRVVGMSVRDHLAQAPERVAEITAEAVDALVDIRPEGMRGKGLAGECAGLAAGGEDACDGAGWRARRGEGISGVEGLWRVRRGEDAQEGCEGGSRGG